jgi:hypothetical protein
LLQIIALALNAGIQRLAIVLPLQFQIESINQRSHHQGEQ